MNVLETIEQKLSPEAIAKGTPPNLTVGHINHGAAIYSAFVVDGEKQGITTLDVLKTIALDAKLSCLEFAQQCKKAQEMADAVDKGNGFLKAEDAKGQDCYGPKRRLLNQRLSEAKQIFGMYKTNPKAMNEKGYWPALAIARDFFANARTKWDGTPIVDKHTKDAKQQYAVEIAARAAVKANVPQDDGETREAYLMRVDALEASAVEAAQADAFNKRVKTVHASFVKANGEEVLMAMFQTTLENMDTESMEALQTWIQEELVCRAIETK